VSSSASQVFLPALYCPIPPVEGLDLEPAKKRLAVWVNHYGIADHPRARKRLEAIRVPDFVARAYPSAQAEDLDILLAWTTWAFLADDLADEQTDTAQVQLSELAARYDSYVETLRHGSTTLSGAHYPLLNLRERIAKRGSAACLGRFADAAQDWFRSMHWEVSNRALQRQPSILEYLKERRVTVGMYTEFALFDVSHQTDASELLSDPTLKEMMEAASNIIAWSNDIFSYPKEAAQGDPHNLVLLLQSEKAYSLKRAVSTARQMHDREMRRFLALDRSILSRAVPSVDSFRFVDMLKCWIRSNVDWAQLTLRYRLRHNSVALTSSPPDDIGRSSGALAFSDG
jgi:Terpene synthase family 2, C-terminal metal binding